MSKIKALAKFNAALQAAKTQIEESSFQKIVEFESQIKAIEAKKPTALEIPTIQDELSKLKKQIEASRKEYSEPLNELFKQNNGLYKPLTDRIDNRAAFLKAAYQNWIVQKEAERKAEIAERERIAAEERARVEAENQKRIEAGEKPIIKAEVVAPPTPPIQFDKSAARKEIKVEFVDFAKLILAIAKNIKDPAWNEIISGFKTQPIQQIARRNISQETIDMFAAAGVKIQYLPTMEAWGAAE